MTWKEMEQSAVRYVACPYCGAGRNEVCRTSSGHVASYAHTARVWPIQSAWAAGHQEGEGDALDAAIDNRKWFEVRVERRRKERHLPT